MLCYAATATRTANKPVGLISKICTCSTLFLYISLPCFAQLQRQNFQKLPSLRWLDTVFQGQYLASLSINYVAIKKDLEKLSPHGCIR